MGKDLKCCLTRKDTEGVEGVIWRCPVGDTAPSSNIQAAIMWKHLELASHALKGCPDS